MSNPVATFAQHNHITEAFRAGTATYAVADIARELVELYRADITGEQAIAAAIELDAQGITGPQVHYVRTGDQLRARVAAAVDGAKAA